jgi:hypothetical protein
MPDLWFAKRTGNPNPVFAASRVSCFWQLMLCSNYLNCSLLSDGDNRVMKDRLFVKQEFTFAILMISAEVLSEDTDDIVMRRIVRTGRR